MLVVSAMKVVRFKLKITLEEFIFPTPDDDDYDEDDDDDDNGIIAAKMAPFSCFSPSNSGIQPGSQMRYSTGILYFTVIIY